MPLCCSMASTSVVLPWSTWAIMAILRILNEESLRSVLSLLYMQKPGRATLGGRLRQFFSRLAANYLEADLFKVVGASITIRCRKVKVRKRNPCVTRGSAQSADSRGCTKERRFMGDFNFMARARKRGYMRKFMMGVQKKMLFLQWTPTIAVVILIMISTSMPALAAKGEFGPSNPFFAPSPLPFQAPPFDKIKDSDYQPAIEAGMAKQREEVRAIADNPASPTFENTIKALEKSGQLFTRVMLVFGGLCGANLNAELAKVQELEAPRLAAHQDAIFLDSKLFQRVDAVYRQRESLGLDPESLHLTEWYHDQFVHSGAKLSDADKIELKKLNEEESTLSTTFTTRLLADQRWRVCHDG